MRPWVWRDDPVFPELMKGVGANGVPLGLPEVFPALQTGMVDTVVASPTAALGLQWFRHVKHMTKQAKADAQQKLHELKNDSAPKTPIKQRETDAESDPMLINS